MPKNVLGSFRKTMLFLLLEVLFTSSSMENAKLPNRCTSALFLKISAWEKPPVETGLVGYEWTAYATIIHIEKSGKFEMIGCILRRSRSNIGISGGDKQTIWIGKVEKRENKYYVRYHQVMDIAGLIPSSREIESELVLTKDYLIFEGDIYDKTTKIDLKDFLSYIYDYESHSQEK